MYKISEFSKITGLTVKALRYYDEQALLIPSSRDKETSYRLYTDDDFKRAALIKVLRSLDFSISEIRDILSNIENEDDLYYYLREKQEMIKRNISVERERIKKIEGYLKPLSIYAKNFEYCISVKEIKAVNVISLRFKGKYSELDKYVPLLYQIAKDACDGKHFNCYYDDECKEEADIELCLPVKRPIYNAKIEYKTIPEIRAISTRHFGAYENICLAYKALYQYASRESILLTTPSRELYIKGPGAIFRGNPDKYITDIFIPF